MINPKKQFDINDYLEIVLRRIWYIIIPFVLISAGTVLYAFHSPKIYRASTLILVTPQKVPTEYVRPTVTSRIEDRLQTIGQEIMSRTRLEKLIAEFKLYSEEAKTLTIEEIVELMRKNIQIEIKGKEGIFTISYTGKDPRIVTTVANKLASLFIEENLKYRELQAQGTTEFLSIELNATKGKLEEQEKAITNFKRQFMTELPEQMQANLKVLEQLQLQYQRVSDSIRAAQDRKLIIQKQLNEMKQLAAMQPAAEDLFIEEEPSVPSSTASPIIPSQPKPARTPSVKPAPSRGSVAKTPVKSHYEVQLEQLRNQLVELESRYTEKHPDIRATRKKIVDLEEKVRDVEARRKEEEEKARADEEKARLEEEKARSEEEKIEEKVEDKVITAAPPILPTPKPKKKEKEKREEKGDMELSPFYKEFEGQVAATDLEIKRLKEEETKIKAQLVGYQTRIENTPLRELMMTTLSRDYQNSKETYQTLMKKSQEATQAENLERRQKGEQFKVIDPARIPEKPFKPDIPRIVLIGVMLSMGVGFGLAFLREQYDRSFRDADDLEAALGIRVVANIPKIKAQPVPAHAVQKA